MTRPRCFKKSFNDKSKFCMEVCKHADDCGGIAINERGKVNAAYRKGLISFKQLSEERFALLKDEIAERRRTSLI